MTEIRVPTLGESVTEATVGAWLKKEGEAVAVDEAVVELETDKVSVSVTAPVAGVLARISARAGETVKLNALLGEIESGNVRVAPKAAASPAPAAPAPAPAAAAAAPARSTAAQVKTVEIIAPSSGESVTQADVGEWMVRLGDSVAADQALVALETDKAAVDVTAPAAGTLMEIRVPKGTTVKPGTVLGLIAVGGAAAAKAASVAAAPVATAPVAAPVAPVAKPAAPAAMSPAPRRVLAEAGVDATAVKGSGKAGRVTKADALAALEQKAKDVPVVTPDAPPRDLGPQEERVKMSRLRQTIARRLKESQSTAAMLSTFNDVDMTAVMDLRNQYKDIFEKKHGVKLGFMSFFVKACVHALREVPEVNAEIDGTDIIYKNHYDIGIAVGTDRGLIVPVVRSAETKSLAQIEKDINDYGRRGRDGTIKLEEMQGGTFTITNGGVYGSLLSTPILNMPQSGILGMHRIEKRPVVINDQVVVRPMMYLALSYDHRIVDGKGAVTFLVRVKENLEDPQRLLLDL